MKVNLYNENTYTQTGKGKETSSVLGKDDFMKILVTQLQNQDQLNHMDDREFISQMTQFTTLEQNTQLNTSMNYSRATGMIGKYAYSEDYDSQDGETKSIYGKVEGMISNYGSIYLQILDKMVPLDSVLGLYEKAEVDIEDE